MKRLANLEKSLVRTLEALLVLLFLAFFILICTLVFLRYGFTNTIYGGNEFVTILFLYTSAVGAAVAIAKREHIAITVVVDLLPDKLRIASDILSLFLVAAINGAMVYYSINWIRLTGNTAWQPFNWSQGFVQAAVPIGCSLAVLFCIVKIVLVASGHEQSEPNWAPNNE